MDGSGTAFDIAGQCSAAEAERHRLGAADRPQALRSPFEGLTPGEGGRPCQPPPGPNPAGGAGPVQGGMAEAWLAPPPDTVVAAERRRVVEAEARDRTREAALRAEHAAEVARLIDLLREAARAHACEVERLRAEHAEALWRVVEARWQARDAAMGGTVQQTGARHETAGAGRRGALPRPSGLRRLLVRIAARR